MAIEQVTNNQAVNTTTVNRADQTTNKNQTNRVSNLQQNVIPGKDFDQNYSVTLKDIDTSVMNHIKNIIKPMVMRKDGVM